MEPAYVGGRLSTIRQARYGLTGRPKNKHELTAGFKAPVPRVDVEGGAKKKQKKFKRKAGTAVAELGKVSDKLAKEIGAKAGETLKQIRSNTTKEKARFRSVMNKAATQLKKAEVRKGSTQKAAKAEAERLKAAFKEDLKKLIAQHTLMAVREFNGKFSG
ncbi:MAG: hypothetical protein ABWZ79_05905 [Pedobacter agri]